MKRIGKKWGGRWGSGSDSGADTSAGRRLDRREIQTSMGGGFFFLFLVADSSF